MRRYIYCDDPKKLEVRDFDALVVGGGIAGLYTALHIDPAKTCAVVTKADFETSNSYLAQGGIAAVIDPKDTFESHIEDTLKAGAGICDRKAVDVLVHEGPENIKELIDLKVPFDTNPEGEILITREGGHSCRRIVHCGGDATGRETTKRLGEIVLERKNITPLFRTYLIDLICEDGRVRGGIFFDEKAGKPFIIRSANVILASGGIGSLYNYTTNPKEAVGDGIAAAGRAGAKVVNMELVQFHPTTMIPHSDSDRLFLISEAVRGEGGILRNHKGEAFMQGKHPLADLAPRDIVTRFIIAEMKKNNEEYVYLDVSSMTREFFAHRFPTIFGECTEFGINLTKEMIPVRPAQHYLMGGIETDLNGKTALDGLYACGECAWTGIHGGNRLASNSILECLVFGRRAARAVNADTFTPSPLKLECQLKADGEKLTHEWVADTRCELKNLMTEYAGAVRTVCGLEKAEKRVSEVLETLERACLTDVHEYELYNAAENCAYILRGALERKESVGAHYVVPEDQK